MAIEFRSAITIGGVNVVPGYPALSGLTAGQVLRASGSGTVAFVALVAADLPATAVTAAAYGSATQVPTFTVDAAGRLTLAANVAIAIAASAITSGQLNLVHGGTGVDLSATG